MDVLLVMGRWIWPVPFVVLVWWLLQKLPPATHEPSEPEWRKRALWFHLEPLDKVGLGILAVLWFFIWLGRSTIFPVPPDSYYHLLTARHIYETGTVPMWDSWEWAPLGRPHLYPPFFHILLAALAVPLHGDLLSAFRIMVTIILPFTYFTTWYLARWLFDSRRAFVALLIVGMDAVLVFSAAMGTPGVLATSLVSLMFVLFLSERYVGAAVLGVLAVYTHLGIPAFAIAGLGLFCVLNRRYIPGFLAMVTIVALAALPWLARIYVFYDWFSHPIDLGVYGEFGPWGRFFMKLSWLQMVNVFLALLAVLAVVRTRWREQRNQLLACYLIAMAPVLLSYGGRYYIHTVHIWAILGAGLFAPLLVAPLRWRRVLALGMLALCPVPSLVGTGTPIPPGMYPAPSAWMLSPPVAFGALRYLDGGKKLGFVSFQNGQEVAALLQARTSPNQILYFSWDRDLALMVGFLAHRPIDVGGWEETMPHELSLELLRWYAMKDPKACFISRARYGIPYDIQERQVGDVYVGFRDLGDRLKAKPAKRAVKHGKEKRKRGGDSAVKREPE